MSALPSSEQRGGGRVATQAVPVLSDVHPAKFKLSWAALPYSAPGESEVAKAFFQPFHSPVLPALLPPPAGSGGSVKKAEKPATAERLLLSLCPQIPNFPRAVPGCFR